jgi:hypothetical protein
VLQHFIQTAFTVGFLLEIKKRKIKDQNKNKMKTNSTPRISISKKVAQKFFAVIFLIGSIGSVNPLNASRIIPGIRIAEYVTGNQLGANLSPSVVFSSGKSTLAFGLNIQQRHMNFSGMQSSFSYNFGNENGKASIFIFSSFIYQKSASLSKTCIKTEQSVSREIPFQYEKIKLSTVEMYVGFGVNIKHNEFISSQWGVGVGMYDTVKGNESSMGLYREKSAAVLMLKCSLTFNFKRQN